MQELWYQVLLQDHNLLEGIMSPERDLLEISKIRILRIHRRSRKGVAKKMVSVMPAWYLVLKLKPNYEETSQRNGRIDSSSSGYFSGISRKHKKRRNVAFQARGTRYCYLYPILLLFNRFDFRIHIKMVIAKFLAISS